MAIAFENVPKEFVSKTAFYDYKTPITEILGTLGTYGAVVLTKDKEYYGIIDDRSIAKKGGTNVEKRAAAGKYAVKVPLLDRETSLAKAIHHFYTTDAKALPYTESGKVLGIVKRDAILKAILSMHMLSSYKAGWVMSTPVIAIDAEKTVAEAASTMRQNGINRLVVTSSGRLFGIVSYKDVLRYDTKLRQRGSSKLEGSLPLMQSKISEITERNVYSLTHNDNVDTAIREMVENGISSILVTRSGKPVGMLTIRDVLSAAAASNVEAAEGIILSGIDSSTKQYEEDIISEAEKLMERIDKFTKFKVGNMAVHVRKHKVRNYEIQVRVWLERSGAISVSSQGYSVEFTLRDAFTKVYNAIRNKKEVIYMGKKTADSQFVRDEE